MLHYATSQGEVGVGVSAARGVIDVRAHTVVCNKTLCSEVRQAVNIQSRPTSSSVHVRPDGAIFYALPMPLFCRC